MKFFVGSDPYKIHNQILWGSGPPAPHGIGAYDDGDNAFQFKKDFTRVLW